MKKRKIVFLVFLVFILNTLWEFLHSNLYINLSGIFITNILNIKLPYSFILILASITDTFLILSIFGIISLINFNLKWILSPKIKDYSLIAILGISIAIIIEKINLGKNWIYTESMPTLLGIGISPLVQLSLTSIISIIILKKLDP